MVEVKHSGKSMEERIADRLKNSGDVQHADHHAVHGTGPSPRRGVTGIGA
jgi:hypothetical protein